MANSPKPYKVQFTDMALKNLKRYPQNDQRRILARIEQLAEDPLAMPHVKRLVDFDVAYRLRVGDYRVLFDRDDIILIIDVIDILPRGRSYRR
jgi:mRNA interferase RelE/StbE